MRLNEKNNLYLIDKEYEVWGLESDEILAVTFAVGIFTFPLFFVHYLLLTVTPLVWLVVLLFVKNKKSEHSVRGRFVRTVLEKLTGKRVWYV